MRCLILNLLPTFYSRFRNSSMQPTELWMHYNFTAGCRVEHLSFYGVTKKLYEDLLAQGAYTEALKYHLLHMPLKLSFQDINLKLGEAIQVNHANDTDVALSSRCASGNVSRCQVPGERRH